MGPGFVGWLVRFSGKSVHGLSCVGDTQHSGKYDLIIMDLENVIGNQHCDCSCPCHLHIFTGLAIKQGNKADCRGNAGHSVGCCKSMGGWFLVQHEAPGRLLFLPRSIDVGLGILSGNIFAH